MKRILGSLPPALLCLNLISGTAVAQEDKKEDRRNPQVIIEEAELAKDAAERRAEEAIQALKEIQGKVRNSMRMVDEVKALESEVAELRKAKGAMETRLFQAAVPTASSLSKEEQENVLEELNACLDKASVKAKLLSESIRDLRAGREKAEKQAAETGTQLGALQKDMKTAMDELARMKEADTKKREQLKALEVRLTESRMQAEGEASKLQSAAKQLQEWETRASKAETELAATRSALENSLTVASDAKALGSKYEEKLSMNTLLLSRSEEKLSSQGDVLSGLQRDAAACAEKLKAVQAELVTVRTSADDYSTQLKKAVSERDRLLESKLMAEKELAEWKGRYQEVEKRASLVPDLENQLAALQVTINEKDKAIQDSAAKFVSISKQSDSVTSKLNETLKVREQLNDSLSLLRADFSSYRKSAQANSTKAEQQERMINDLQNALMAKEQALQAAYGREKELAAKAGSLEKSHATLKESFEKLKSDLNASQKKACELQDQLGLLEKLSLGTE